MGRFSTSCPEISPRSIRPTFGLSHFPSRNTLVSLRYGADTQLENGFRLGHEWLFRVGYRF